MMKLLVRRSQSESAGLLGGKKKYTYSLRITANLTPEEAQLLGKYDYLKESFYCSTECMKAITVDQKIKGEAFMDISKLEKGIEWSCENSLSPHFATMPSQIASVMQNLLGMALAREKWNGEETLEIG